MNYDQWKANAPEDDGPDYTTPCPVCTGAEDEPPCSEECARLILRAFERRRVLGLLKACARARRWARLYAQENGHPFGQRVHDCLAQIREYHWELRSIRSARKAALAEDAREATTLPAPAEEAAQ